MTRVYVFSNGSQFGDWTDRNCERCVKYEPDGAPGACDLDRALMDAYIGDGKVEPEIAERIGYVEGVAFGLGEDGDGVAYTWDCPERVLTPAALRGSSS